MNRIERLQAIAEENGVKAFIRELGGSIYANINGVSFKVKNYGEFEVKCHELKDYVKPAPVDLTPRLATIENATIIN